MRFNKLILEKTDKHYNHYAKCIKPIEKCFICQFVFGGLTQEKQNYLYRRGEL